MKTAIFCVFLLLAAVLCIGQQTTGACNPNGNGQPDCTAKVASSATFRNNWDPTHYWVCVGGQAKQAACPQETLYDPSSKACVPYEQWQWVPPCPEVSSK